MKLPMKYMLTFSLFFESRKIDYVTLISETTNSREFLIENLYIASDKTKTPVLHSYLLRKQKDGFWVDDTHEPSQLSKILGKGIELFRMILYN